MTRNKKATCSHDGVEATYRVVTGDDYEPPDPAARNAALTHLADTLNALPGPLHAALAAVTPRDISLLLSRAPLERRRHALTPLGLRLSPRVVGQTLCQDVLRLLRQVHLHDAKHAAFVLTYPARALMRAATIASYDEAAPLTETDGMSVSEFSDAVLCMTLWSTADASVGDARLLLWAGNQPWWLPQGLSAEQGAAVLAAAQAVVAASPDFTFTAPERASEHWEEGGHTIEARTEPAPDTETSHFPAKAAAPTQPAPIVQVLDEEHPLTANTIPTLTADLLTYLQTDRAAIDKAREAATAALQAAQAAVDDGAPVTGETLEPVQAYSALLEQAAERMATVAGPVPARLEDIDAALEQASASLAASARIERVQRLRHLTGPHAHTVAALVDQVHDTPDDNTSVLQALTSLADLLDLLADGGVAKADPQRLLELQNRVMAGLPGDLASVPMAAIAGQLHWADTADATPSDAAAVSPLSGAVASGPVATAASAPGQEKPTAVVDGFGRAASRAQTETAPSPDVEEPTALPEPLEVAQPAPSGHAEQVTAAHAVQVHAPVAATTTPGSATTTEAPQRPAAGDADIDAVLGDLIVARRFALAADITDAAGGPSTRAAALRVAALADAVRGETGPCAARLRDLLPTLDADDLAGEGAVLHLLAPALLRAALVTGEPATGALLTALAPRLESNLGLIAEQVGRRSLQGVLVGNPLRSVLADAAELETRVRAAADAASQRLRPRTLRFKRATDIAHRWLAPTGLLGTLLTAAANDDRSRVAAVTVEVLRLSGHGDVSREIDRLDAQLRGHGSKPVEGSGRQDLVGLATDALAAVSGWLEAVASVEASRAANSTWATAELTEMRTVVLAHVETVLAALDEQASRTSTITGAAAIAARDSLATTFALLDGATTLRSGEPPADLVLTAELLKVPGAEVDPVVARVTTPEDTTLAALLAAARSDWKSAFTAQIAAEQYPAAGYLLRLERTGVMAVGIQLPADAADQLATSEHRSRVELAGIREQQLAELRRARLQNEISEEQDGELTGVLDAADPQTRSDLSAVRAQLARAGELLPRYRDEAAQRLRDRLAVLVTSSRMPVDETHIRRLIDAGLLSTAEELIYFCEIGEPVPEAPVRADFGRFFPVVPDALPHGLTADVVSAARSGLVAVGCGVLDYSELSGDARTVVGDALEAWRLAGSTPADGGRTRIDDRAVLLPTLRLAGYEFEPGAKVHRLDLHKGRERRFVEVTGVSWNGKAMVPAFGSKLRGRLRVLLVWGQQPEDLVMSWVDQDTSGDAVLVAYFGTMPAAARRRLAARSVGTDAPVAVLDDAALAYLAAHGERQLDATMAVLLPFSAVQPYVRHKRSLVAPEMFYGRDYERKAVLAPEGTQVIFGGRGLGKSALLRDAKAAFEREPGRIAIHIELTTVDIGPGKQDADAVWDVLLRELETAEVVNRQKAARRGKSAYEDVRAGVLDWLAVDPRRRLLVLLDESDGFFESDAPRFLETNRLKDLGQAAGVEGRVKVVFAGLHSVQRFAKMSNNTFKHLAQRPTVIGPLRPQFAYNLIARPTEALGFSFEDPDLVNRILGYCSYQPFLLQMFGHRLVEHMHRKRRSGVDTRQPPFVITRADVEMVEADPDLKADITSTFRDTLNLDPRYNVIANVLAHQAHEHGMDLRLSDVALREECLAYWPAGFAGLNVEGFRAYLQEMVGLGVLAPNNDGRGWHLRSPNVLRMIGSRDDVTAELVHAESEAVPSEFIALSTRRLLPDGRTRSPLTAAQVDDLLGDHANQVRVVLGSAAVGVENVATTLRAVCADLGERYDLVEPRGRKPFEDALVAGALGRRRLVLSDLVAMAAKDDACAQALTTALSDRPTSPGVTRSVVIVAGTDQLRFWQSALADAERPGLGVVTLRRHDRRSLRVWALDTGRFSADDRQARLLDVTGGWPILVERATALAAEHESEDAALAELEQYLSTADGAADHLDAVGLTADEGIAAAFEAVTQVIDAAGATLADLVEIVEVYSDHPDPQAAIATLEALGVFDVDEDGAYSMEPLTVRCWPYRRAAVNT